MTSDEVTDSELWDRAVGGEPECFGVVFERHARSVYNHCFRRTANWADAEELTSAVFVEAWRRRRDIRPEGDSARPWLLGVANNLLRNHRRSLGRYRAALAVGFGVATAAMTRDGGSASANTAHLADDGSILITLREPHDPEALQRRLNDLGVPAVVDFLDSGYGCDEARSDAWVTDHSHPERLFSHASSFGGPDGQYILHPDELHPGETMALEFQFDEHEGNIAAMANLRVSAGPVGACVPVADGSIVDAEAGIAGG